MRLGLVDVFLLLITFSRRLETLSCAKVNVAEQFQQAMLLTMEDRKLDSSMRLSFERRKYIDHIDKLYNPQLFVCVIQSSHSMCHSKQSSITKSRQRC